MRKFVFNLIKFFLTPVVFVLTLETTIYIKKNSFFTETSLAKLFINEADKYYWINQINSDSIIFLTGSSSVKYGLSCSELNSLSNGKYSFVNLAMDARDPIQTYFIIKYLDTQSVSKIFFGLDPWIYSKRYYIYRDKYMYLDYSFLQTIYVYLEYDKSAFIKRYSSLFNYFLRRSNSNKKNKERTIPKDFGSETLYRSASNFNEPVSDWFQIEKYGWSALQFDYLRKIEDLCSERKIKFYVFVPPKRSDYNLQYKKLYSEYHNKFIKNISERNLSSPIFGKYDLLGDSGDSIYFSEAYHLNKEGQKKYSQIFYESFKNDIPKFSSNYSWFLNN